MKRPAQIISVLLTALLLSACAGQRAQPLTPAQAPATPTGVYSTDDWLGQWDGPEATFLRLDGGGNDYLVTIRNLDGTRTFLGSRKGGMIQFQRDGVSETIRHTDGEATGMKWLADKTNCLTIKKGEGYCKGGSRPAEAPTKNTDGAATPDKAQEDDHKAAHPAQDEQPAEDGKASTAPAPDSSEPERKAPEEASPETESPEHPASDNTGSAQDAPFQTRPFDEEPDSAPGGETSFPEPQA